jgi:ribosomal protein S18 acetylase RimI-like enzyme
MLTFYQYLSEMQSNEYLSTLLEPHGGHYGAADEKTKRLSPTVTVHSTQFGSHRFVKHDASGNRIAAIQVVSREKGNGHVANAYTHPDHRRAGHGSELIGHAKRMFKKKLSFSDDRSGDGQAFVKNVDK